MDWKDYEDLVKDIYTVLGKSKGIKIECSGNTCVRKGKSGVNHQIDVLTSHSDGIHTYYTVVECKYWKEKVNKDIVMKVKEILDDLNYNKAVIVTKKGFTPDAITYAQFRNVELIELREPLDKDWEGRVKDIIIQMHILSPNLIRYENLVDKDVFDKYDNKERYAFTEDYIYYFPDGSKKTMKEIVQNFLQKLKELNVEIEEELKFEKGTKLISENNNYDLEVLGVKLKGVLTEAVETIEIRGEKLIWMIMKMAFEKKSFGINKNGEIRELGSSIS